VAAPRPDEIGYIHDTYFQLASAGRGAEQHHAGLTKLAHALPRLDQSPDGSPRHSCRNAIIGSMRVDRRAGT
jgi:hypothetical protein